MSRKSRFADAQPVTPPGNDPIDAALEQLVAPAEDAPAPEGPGPGVTPIRMVTMIEDVPPAPAPMPAPAAPAPEPMAPLAHTVEHVAERPRTRLSQRTIAEMQRGRESVEGY